MQSKRSILEPLDKFGEYKVSKRGEGRGTFGDVHLVQKDGEGEVYALKRINLSSCGDKDKQHCHDEVRQLKQADHENLVKFIDSFQEGHYLCIVMEYCKGGNLRQYIKSLANKLGEDEFLRLFKQICEGLKYLHDRNIAHRDVKTTNILLTEDAQIKIADFGLAKDLENHALTKKVGSPYYMSLEMFNGQDYSTKTDIWSLACCMFEMGTKTILFTSRDQDSLKKEIEFPEKVEKHAKDLPFCKPLQQMFCAMLYKDSASRPSIDDLLQFVASHTHEPRAKQGPIPSGRRRKPDFSKTCPARIGPRHDGLEAESPRDRDWLNPGRNNMERHQRHDSGYQATLDDSSSGIDTDVSENHDRHTVQITAEIYVTEQQRECYDMMKKAEAYVSAKIRGNMMQEIREALFDTKNQPDERAFMDRAKSILGGPIFQNCEVHLRSFRNYKIELFKYKYEMA